MITAAAGRDALEGCIESVDFGADFLGASNELVG